MGPNFSAGCSPGDRSFRNVLKSTLGEMVEEGEHEKTGTGGRGEKKRTTEEIKDFGKREKGKVRQIAIKKSESKEREKGAEVGKSVERSAKELYRRVPEKEWPVKGLTKSSSK